jgi:hypothetical protein
MNGQPTPIDSQLRDQLARRAAGRTPDDLLAEVLAAVDSAPATRARARWLRPMWRVPRLAAAGIGVTLVAILAVALAVPGLRGGPAASPAGYPTDRAFTTAELAALLAGPPLATNTPLVVTATIDIRSDVCPMNRYPTVGVIDGMDPQVCVMEGGLPPVLTGNTATGTFALRFLGGRTFGLLGEITPASSSRLAFHAADDWPLAGKTFLVDGWLGAVETTASCMQQTAGDVLSPNGEDCPYMDWLGDDSTAPGIQADYEYDTGSPEPSYDPLSLRGNARHVGAGGMRAIDSVDPNEPHRGVFVVRSVVEQCPNASPQDNAGCGAWLVLAKVVDISLPQPTAPPTPLATPLAGYPADRALTTAELASLLAGPALPTNTALVASVTIAPPAEPCPLKGYATLGPLEGMSSQVCVVVDDTGSEIYAGGASGTFAFRYLAPGYLGLMGAIAPASDSRLAFHATEDWPTAQAFLVDGWLGAYQHSCPFGLVVSPGDVLNPDGEDPCETDWLTDDPNAQPSVDPTGGILPPGGGQFVEAGGMRLIDNVPGDAPNLGVFVVERENGAWRVLAKVADISPAESSPAPASPTPTPAMVPVATPVASPSASFTPAPAGLIGPDDRALAPAELSALIAADPSHLSGRYVIDKRVTCDGTDCSGVAPKALADVIQPDGSIALVGPVDLRPDGGLVWTVPQALAAYQNRFIFIVDAWMFTDGQSAWLDSDATAELTAQDGTFSQFAPAGTPAGTAVHGLFLVQRVEDGKTCGLSPTASAGNCFPQGEILARLEVATP